MNGLEVYPLKKSNIRSLDCVVDKLFVKLFKTNYMDIMSGTLHFCFKLPNNLLPARSE